MKRIKIIEMPRKEIRLEALDKSVISAGDNCSLYTTCGGTKTFCMNYNNNECGCGGDLYCGCHTEYNSNERM